MRAIFVGLVAISFTLTAVGCGGDPCADYEKKLCADEKSKGACEDFKKQLAKAKSDGTSGDLKKTCETSLANWDKRGEGAGKNEEKAKEAAARMEAIKKSCTDQGGTYTQEKGCMCADGKPQKIAMMDGDKPAMKDGKKVWEREACPAPAPPKKEEPPKPPAGANAGAAGGNAAAGAAGGNAAAPAGAAGGNKAPAAAAGAEGNKAPAAAPAAAGDAKK